MQRFRQILLEVWREACRHIEIGESTLTIARLLSRQLPLAQIKIDKFFVGGIGNNAKIELIVQTLIGMAANLDLEIVAEGVETREQLDFLVRHGCRMYQGFFFGRPLTFEELEGQLDVELAPDLG